MDRLLSAPEPLVHSVLVALCDDDRVQARALKYLAELQNYATQVADADAGDPAGAANPLKRKASAADPAQLCVQCKQAFSLADNSPTACRHHDGELEVFEDHDVWADWGEDVGGPGDSRENQEDHPEAFTWTCCGQDGTMPGCTKGYHLAVRKNHFKRFHMYSPPEADPGMSRVFEGRVLKANEFVNESLGSHMLPAFSSLRAWGLTGDSASDRTERDSQEYEESAAPQRDEGVEVT